ncbi:MAG: hypothetical protein K2I33_04445, partial [Oscillospiraceae bacterium]|nr:hypothetical protein [Oscillospiraceae bacterium]
MVNDIYND